MKIKAGIIGATGYAGAELVRILLTHPEAEISAISSVSFEGKKLSEVYPSYKSLCDMECKNQDEVVEKSDVIFAALPHGLSQELAAQCDKAGKAFIDLGADFRLESEEEYKEWLKQKQQSSNVSIFQIVKYLIKRFSSALNSVSITSFHFAFELFVCF